MSIDYDTYKKKLIEAEDFKKELNDWIDKRKRLIRLLINLANECDKHQHNCDVAEVVGGTTGAVGGLGLLGASLLTFLTGGAAAPLLVGAAAAAATLGTATAVGTKITHSLIDSSLKKDIDDLLADDKEAIRRLESRYKKLNFPDMDDLLKACLFMGVSFVSYVYMTFSKSQIGRELEEEGILDLAINNITMLLENLGTNITELMMSRIWCAAFAIAGAAVLIFSITAIVESSTSIHNGSKSELGNKVRNLVKGFEEQLKHAEDLINAIKSHKIDDVNFLKKAIKKMLQTISERESSQMSEDEYRMISLLIKDWLNWLQEHNPSQRDEKAIIDCFVNLYRNSKDKTEQKKPESHLIFIILAHGTIFNKLVPSSSYYGYGPGLITNVRLYAPWGTLLNATAAASILMGKDRHGNMKYIRDVNKSRWVEAQVYNSHGSNESVYTAETFNNVPQNDLLLPLIELTATFVDEGVIKATKGFMTNNNIHPDHIVIPYFNEKDSWMFYPPVPSLVLNSLLKIICWVMDFTCEIKSVHCLEACTNSGFDMDKPVPTGQYWSTVPREQVIMCDKSFDEKPHAEFLKILQKALNN